jgi:hypothetical protein
VADPIGVSGGEHDRRRPALGDAEQSGPLGPDGVEHGDRVARVVLEREHRRPVREALPAPVEQDHPREAREAVDEPRGLAQLVQHFEVADEPGQHEQIQRPLAHDAIGDVDVVAGRRVSDGRRARGHGASLPHHHCNGRRANGVSLCQRVSTRQRIGVTALVSRA